MRTNDVVVTPFVQHCHNMAIDKGLKPAANANNVFLIDSEKCWNDNDGKNRDLFLECACSVLFAAIINRFTGKQKIFRAFAR